MRWAVHNIKLIIVIVPNIINIGTVFSKVDIEIKKVCSFFGDTVLSKYNLLSHLTEETK